MKRKLFQGIKQRIKKTFQTLGPGFVTGAADDDPSGIATYSQTGSLFGYAQLWTALYSLPFMVVVQEACGRIGMVTGTGLAGNIREHYSRKILFCTVLLLLAANMINIGADLGAMANCLQLLMNIPFALALFGIVMLTLLLQIFVTYQSYAKYLKYLALTLVAYIITAFIVKQDWEKIAWATLIPSVSYSKEYLTNIVAILGTTISPYLFFWQAGQEVEEQVAKHHIPEMQAGRPRITRQALKKMRWDTIIGMFFSALIMWFIIITTTSTLHVHHISAIQTADQAALALKPLAGEFAFVIFAIGIIATGLLAVPVLSGSAAYAICETFKLKEGLSKKLKAAPIFYAVIVVSTLIGLLTNFLAIKPFQMLYYTAVLNGICAPPLLIMIFFIANNKKIMEKRTNSRLANVLLLIIIAIMSITGVALLFQLGS